MKLRRAGAWFCILCLWVAVSAVPCAWPLEDSLDPTQWYQRAAEDFEVAGLLLAQDDYYGSVCFHSHQAIEKVLKGALIQEGVSPERTHHTADLVSRLSKFYPELKTLKGSCSEMDRLYVPSRYPKVGGVSFEKEDAAECLAKARAVLELVEEKSLA